MFLGARNSILTTFYYLNTSVYNLSEYSKTLKMGLRGYQNH